MLMKICIAAAVAPGFSLAVPAASYAADDTDKSDTSTKAATHHKKKGHADVVHERTTGPRRVMRTRCTTIPSDKMLSKRRDAAKPRCPLG
jgi:hypothetical protein